MTRAFKVFLLIILSFGSVWAYQFRVVELEALLSAGLAEDGGVGLAGLRSPVDRVLDPRDGRRMYARVHYDRPAFPPEPLVVPEASIEGPEFAAPDPADEAADLANAERPPQTPPFELTPRETPVPRAYGEADGADLPEQEPRPFRFAEQASRFADQAPRGGAKKGGTEGKKSERGERRLEKPEPSPSTPAADEKARTDPARVPPPSRALPNEGGPRSRGARPKVDRSKPPEPAPANGRPGPQPGPRSKPSAGLALGESAPVPRLTTVNHVVREKETLASLARRYYQNDTERWRSIFAANQTALDDPHFLPPGTVLQIPDVAPPPRRGVSPQKKEAKSKLPRPSKGSERVLDSEAERGMNG